MSISGGQYPHTSPVPQVKRQATTLHASSLSAADLLRARGQAPARLPRVGQEPQLYESAQLRLQALYIRWLDLSPDMQDKSWVLSLERAG